MISKNVELLSARKLSSWRKISLGSWKPNGDSQVYCEILVNATTALKKITSETERTGQKITMTHLIGKVMGKVLRDVPDLNCLVRLGQIYPRRDVDIFFHVAIENSDLSGSIIRSIDSKTLQEISQELTMSAKEIKDGKDLSFKRIKNSWSFIPSLCAKYTLNLISFVSYTLNINIRGSNIPKDCFGSMMITNIGSLGFSSAFVPLAPYTRIPLILALGKTQLKPVCLEDGSIVAQEQVSLCFTFDHRIMDGARGAKMAKAIQFYMENPDLLD